MKKTIFLLAIFMFCAWSASADVIYLKEGKKVKGKILQETGYSYKIDVGGIPFTYYQNEVEKVIKGDDPAEAEQAPAGQGTSPGKKELILRLLDANGARDSMNRIFAQILQDVPEKERPAAQEILKVDDVIQRLIPIYAKYYSEEELKELITFYRSPVGTKNLQVLPKVMAESMQEAIKYFQEKAGPEEGATPSTK